MLVIGSAATAVAENVVAVNTGVDLYNRYVWRGLDIANTPSIQPSLSAGYSGFELGAWGAYTLSNQASESDEIDFWLAYTYDLKSGASVTALVTDYYYPNAGIGFFSFENYDGIREIVYNAGYPPTADTLYGGAHTLEAGLSVTGAESFPFTFSGFINVYNDAGNNAYVQLDYPFAVNETGLNLFVGAAAGSKDNPDYYGADNFQVINLGVTAVRELEISESFSLPLTVSFVLNPREEISYLLVAVSF